MVFSQAVVVGGWIMGALLVAFFWCGFWCLVVLGFRVFEGFCYLCGYCHEFLEAFRKIAFNDNKVHRYGRCSWLSFVFPCSACQGLRFSKRS